MVVSTSTVELQDVTVYIPFFFFFYCVLVLLSCDIECIITDFFFLSQLRKCRRLQI